MERKAIDWAEHQSLEKYYQRLADFEEGRIICEAVDELLRRAVDQNASRILLRKLPLENSLLAEDDPGYPCSNGGRFGWFTVEYQVGDSLEEAGNVPIHRWYRLIARLKVIAKVVDYGVCKSANSKFNYDLGDGREAVFELMTNPNPYLDHAVEIEVQGNRDY